MTDTGNTKLKAKVLDLISKLRIEANVLNTAKNAKNNSMQGAPMLKDVSKYGDDFKEPLGLDDNG